jgi:hypothetical protein
MRARREVQRGTHCLGRVISNPLFALRHRAHGSGRYCIESNNQGAVVRSSQMVSLVCLRQSWVHCIPNAEYKYSTLVYVKLKQHSLECIPSAKSKMAWVWAAAIRRLNHPANFLHWMNPAAAFYWAHMKKDAAVK